jgi:RND family efflux transporter MFP subunit
MNDNLNEDQLWIRFIEAASREEFCSSWLALLCRQINGVKAGLVLFGEPDQGPYAPVAIWPAPGVDVTYLTQAAEKAITKRRGLFIRADSNDARTNFHVAFPLMVADRLHGVVILDVGYRNDEALQEVLRTLYWAGAWIENLFLRLNEGQGTAINERLTTVLELLAVCLDQDKFKSAAMALVTELATRLDCERVSYGAMPGDKIEIIALSHTADFGSKMNLLNLISAAMEEAIDQVESIALPVLPGKENSICRAHKDLSLNNAANAVCSIPILHNEKILGALTLERNSDQPFLPDEIETCETLAAFVGPVLELKRRDDRWLLRKAWDSGLDQLRKLVGPSHFIAKIVSILVVALVLFFLFAKGDYRVKCQARIEGEVQQAIVAPFAGYIFKSEPRAGDLVKEGDVLAFLDDRDLKIEQLKWKSRKEQLVKQYRKALAEHDRPQARIIESQINQAEAQIDLTEEQLIRTRIKSPFAGIIISGDLSQSLGSPVERGQLLFEVAPLHNYRIVLDVDEKDIDELRDRQDGELLLSSLPEQKFAFQVKLITPVATAREGHNYFLVEATLHEDTTRLRPGMEGIGKINIEERKLFWIWTHDIIDWCRLKLWEYLP